MTTEERKAYRTFFLLLDELLEQTSDKIREGLPNHALDKLGAARHEIRAQAKSLKDDPTKHPDSK